MATLLEDISNMQKLFRMCFFCLLREENMENSIRLSFNALRILLDEEWNVLQCL